MTNDPSFESLYVPDNPTPEDLARCFVPTGVPEFVTQGSLAANHQITHRLTLVNSDDSTVYAFVLPATARVGESYTVSNQSTGSYGVVVSLGASSLWGDGNAEKTVANGVTITFTRVANDSWLALSQSAL